MVRVVDQEMKRKRKEGELNGLPRKPERFIPSAYIGVQFGVHRVTIRCLKSYHSV
jgi:hypothetical protein